MDLPTPISVKTVAEKIGAKLFGNADLMVKGLNEIHKVREGDLTFVDHPKYYDKSLNSAATIIVIDKEVDVPEGKCVLVCNDPFEAYDGLVREYRPFRPLNVEIAQDAKIGEGTILEPGVTIAGNVVIGENCYLESGVYLGPNTVVGNDVHIGPRTVIGSDAFYYKKKGAEYTKWRTGGRVVIHDRVDIGANCTINSGVSGDTVIGEGSKLDCLIHLGHGAVIGKNCLLAAQVGIGGKTIVGDRCVFYGQVGIAQSLKIGDDVIILAKSGVSKDLAPGQAYFGTPAEPAREKYRELASLRMLPDLIKKLKK